MYKFILDDFIGKGKLMNISTREFLSSDLTPFITQKSNSVNKYDLSEILVLSYNHAKITVGIEGKNIVKYKMFRIPSYNENMDFTYKGFNPLPH